MKQFAVIYGEFFMTGSHSNSVTRALIVEAETASDAVKASGVEDTCIWAVVGGKDLYIADWS